MPVRMSIVYDLKVINLRIVKTYETLYFCASNNLQKFQLNREGFSISALVSKFVTLLLDIFLTGEIKARVSEKHSLRTLDNPSFGKLIWTWDKFIQFEDESD